MSNVTATPEVTEADRNVDTMEEEFTEAFQKIGDTGIVWLTAGTAVFTVICTVLLMKLLALIYKLCVRGCDFYANVNKKHDLPTEQHSVGKALEQHQDEGVDVDSADEEPGEPTDNATEEDEEEDPLGKRPDLRNAADLAQRVAKHIEEHGDKHDQSLVPAPAVRGQMAVVDLNR